MSRFPRLSHSALLAASLLTVCSSHADDFQITIDPSAKGLRIFRAEDLSSPPQSSPRAPATSLFSMFPSKYPWHTVMTTVFWPGEPGNLRSAFDPNWVFNAPNQTQYFFALPYTDIIDSSHTKPEAARIPWFRSSFVCQGKSVLEGRW